MFTNQEKEEIVNYLIENQGTVYFGCDSYKYRDRKGKWMAKYGIVLVVHKNDCNGCKIFSYTEHEPDFDGVKKPRLRLMNEVYKVAECYLEFAGILEGRHCEIHLDINANECHASNSVAKQAVGYILGVTGVTPSIKPSAFAASYAADVSVKGVSRSELALAS